MKIQKIEVDWRLKDLTGEPNLVITIDKLHSLEEFRFNQKEDIYYAEFENEVKFYSYRGPGRGFGGNNLPIIMEGGERKVLQGPWSSRASFVNLIGFGPAIDVQFKLLKADLYQRTSTPGHCTVEAVQAFLDTYPECHFEIFERLDFEAQEPVWRVRIKEDILPYYIKKFSGTE